MTDLQGKRKKNSPQFTKYHYPAYLNIYGRKCIIIGGGRVAERKCLSLLKAGANVTIISPSLTKKLEDYKKKGKIKHISRSFKGGDLKSAFIVIAATNSLAINREVYDKLKGKNVLLNIVDNPHLCNFIVPSVFERGKLKISISTGGISPALSKQIKKELKALYGKDFARYLNLVEKLRDQIKKKIKARQKRQALLRKLASTEFINLLRQKGYKTAKEEILSILSIKA